MTTEELRLRKRIAGLTAEELASGSGVPLPTVQKILSGATKNPRPGTLGKLERFLNEHTESQCSWPGTAFFREPLPAYGSEKYFPRQGEYTVDDLLEIMEPLPEWKRMELIDGVIYDMGQPSVPHQIIVTDMLAQISECIDKHGMPCLVLPDPGLRFSPEDLRNYFSPDVTVTCRKDIVTEKWLIGAPDFVAEVLSPSTRKKDLSIKRRKYLSSGVRELWIIDPAAKIIIADRLRALPPAADIAQKEKSSSGELPEELKPYYDTSLYTFDDIVPVAVSEGLCSIDFPRILGKLAGFGF